MSEDRTTYVLVDGENVDWALGSILDHKPEPNERPRWQRLVDFAATWHDQPVRALFFLNATNHVPMSFVQALMAMDYRPVLLSGDAEEKVVDIGIQKTLHAISDHGGDVMLASHDADFAADMTDLANAGHRVAVIGFPELLSHELREVPDIAVFDLETDAEAFSGPLPRIRVIPLADFDPVAFL